MTRFILKYKDSLLAIILVISLVSFNSGISKLTIADNVSTSVEVGNSAPTFTVNPHEDPASTSSSPTNEGEYVVFKATATDANGDNWKLLICSSNILNATSCADTTYCSSNYVSSGSEATCSYQTQSSDSWSNAWYGFACDSIGCSSYSQGSGDSGSPFYTNHRPTFTAISDCGSANPNASCLISASSTDPDTSYGDSISLYVCKTSGFSTSTPGCTGGEWCHVTGQSSNPSCTIPNVPRPDGSYNYYPYIIDSFKLPANSANQGSNQTYDVNNVAPSIDASTIHLYDTDGSGNLTLLSENGWTNGFYVTFIVNDNNSCKTITNGNEIVSALINLRMSELTQSDCDQSGEYNANNCYPAAYGSWNLVCNASSSVDSCVDSSDTTVGWACTFPLLYHAEPTVTGTPKAAYNWVAAVKATDDDGLDTGLVDSTTYSNEMDTFTAYDLSTTTLSYGTLSPGQESAEKIIAIIATGNVGLDETLEGTALCNDYPTCAGSDDIAVSQQHYATSTGLGWSNMTPLSGTTTRVEINCPKTTVPNSPESKNTYWVLKIPENQPTGIYTGQNTIIGVTDQSYGGS